MKRPDQTALADLREIQILAALGLDGHHWLLPQGDIRSLEPPLGIDPEVRAPGSIGAIGFQGEWWPIYCLSGELQLLSRPPESRRICVLLNNDADRFGLICDRIEALAERPRLFELPACMALARSPIQALARFHDGLGYVTTTEHLAALIAALVENTDG